MLRNLFSRAGIDPGRKTTDEMRTTIVDLITRASLAAGGTLGNASASTSAADDAQGERLRRARTSVVHLDGGGASTAPPERKDSKKSIFGSLFGS